MPSIHMSRMDSIFPMWAFMTSGEKKLLFNCFLFSNAMHTYVGSESDISDMAIHSVEKMK